MEKQRFIFDLDGTLLNLDYSYEKEYFESTLGKENSIKFVSMICKLLDKYEFTHPKLDLLELSEYLSDSSGIKISPKVLEGWIQASGEADFVLNNGVFDVLENLKFRNKSIVILTNWFLESQMRKLERSGIIEYIDEIYDGQIALKPSRFSYKLACGRYPVEEAVMIGDSLEKDIYGAMQIGLNAVYYNPNNNDYFDKKKVKSIKNLRVIKEIY